MNGNRLKNRLEQGTLKTDFNWIDTKDTAGNLKLFAKHSGTEFMVNLFIGLIELVVYGAFQVVMLIGKYPIHFGAMILFLAACFLIPAVGEGIAKFIGLLFLAVIIAIPFGLLLYGIVRGLGCLLDWYFERRSISKP